MVVFSALFLTYQPDYLYNFKIISVFIGLFEMKIVIADIPDEGLEVTIEERVELEDVSLSGPVISQLSLNKVATEIIITGRLKAEMELQCSRCL